MNHRASVVLSFEVMAGLLHLREGLSVVGAIVDAKTEAVEFILAGDSLPLKGRRE